MNVVINTKNEDIRNFVKKEVEDRFSKLEKYFSDEATANVMFSEEGAKKKVEITFKIRNNILRSEVKDFEYRTAADKAIDRIERQLVKYKQKLQKRNNDTIRYDNITASVEPESHFVVRKKKFNLLPITPEEACFQLELLEHSFYMFLNSETDMICVIYKRDDGDYGLIEPEL